ncbi:MAG TPA: F0F1 ATP synthase subunit alpha [Candidatus Limihabitans stercoravium]|nr:F0F1 ATP synthase subunit alpha [Candidatus Limihabitans stercoravium]
MKKTNNVAVVYSDTQPSEKQLQGLAKFLSDKHNCDITVEWKQDKQLTGGFRLEYGAYVYDWTREGKLRQLKSRLEQLSNQSDIIPLLKQTVEDWSPVVKAEEQGSVLYVGDGIATVNGIEHATYGEIVIFESGVRGMVQDLNRHNTGCVVFGDCSEIRSGSKVFRTGKTAGIPVGEGFLGRVVDALGYPVDGKGEIEAEDYRPVEMPAPSIIDRQPVNKPMETGLLVIDSMFPIGRGQRELIIGDRQTGKTAIAIDTIINQKGKDVICIYVAIGQKASSVVRLEQTLEKHGAMDYTIIVNASAGESAPMQYIAPYSGCALAEYFMYQGKDVLIVYDDLSKHAVAYRTLSLLLGRSPGREAYPGDVFYLHSRLLERSAHLSDEKGGGSITALPIVETQAGDVSAYIPTNIISITDGQIFLESELFFQGQRPAVNVGLSVSRVGGAAQTKALKKASGTVRLDLAQCREMQVFTQFASDLDDVTKQQLQYGMGLMSLLKQPQYHPYTQTEQVVLLVSALSKCLQHLKPAEVNSYAKNLLEYTKQTIPTTLRRIDQTQILTDDDKAAIVQCAKQFRDQQATVSEE